MAEAEGKVVQAWDSLKMAKRGRDKAVKKANRTAQTAETARGKGNKKAAGRTDKAAVLAARNCESMVKNANQKESIYDAAAARTTECYQNRNACASELEHLQREELFAMLEVIRLVNGGKVNPALRIVFPSTSISRAKIFYPSHHSTIHIDPKWNLREKRRDQIRSAYSNIED